MAALPDDLFGDDTKDIPADHPTSSLRSNREVDVFVLQMAYQNLFFRPPMPSDLFEAR
jgi:hypothetical protein